jgi:glycosyltransferase involved in cell wall biosynthesis
MKVALVHDYLVQYGGAERVLEAFTELYPQAPIYTLLYDTEAMQGRFADRIIKTSFLQRLPFAKTRHRLFPPFMPLAIEQFDFSEYDLVISDSSSYAKGILTGPETLHVCYMHTPMRYAWDDCQKYTLDFGFPKLIERLVPIFMNPIRLWDRVSAARPDYLFANSRFVAKRIEKYYHRQAEVIYPPVNIRTFQGPSALSPSALEKELSQERYFLMVGRLIAYKRHDIAIQAFNELGYKLKIIGRGPEYERLRKLAGPTVEFLGRIPDKDLPLYYRHCEAFIFPQEEDFGIVAIEALASGSPLIAFRGGDIEENLSVPEQGVFFEEQSSASLKQAVKDFEKQSFERKSIPLAVRHFDKDTFRDTIKLRIESLYRSHLVKKQHGDTYGT